MALINSDKWSGKREFNMSKQKQVPNFQLGVLNYKNFKELHKVVGDDFFNDTMEEVMHGFKPFHGVPIKYSELA